MMSKRAENVRKGMRTRAKRSASGVGGECKENKES
jgi:hypothetical protein